MPEFCHPVHRYLYLLVVGIQASIVCCPYAPEYGSLRCDLGVKDETTIPVRNISLRGGTKSGVIWAPIQPRKSTSANRPVHVAKRPQLPSTRVAPLQGPPLFPGIYFILKTSRPNRFRILRSCTTSCNSLATFNSILVWHQDDNVSSVKLRAS